MLGQARVEGSSLDDLKTVGQVVAAARSALAPEAYAWAEAAAGRGRTRDRNRAALATCGLVPALCRDVSVVDTSAEVLGVPTRLPVFLAPIGSTTMYAADGSVAVARAATARGTTAFCGFMSEQSWADVAAVDPGRQLFQLYVLGDDAWLGAVLDTVRASGFAGLCVTVDSPRASRRDSLLELGVDWRLERENLTANLAGLGRDESWRARFSWASLAELCAASPVPVAVKGVLSARDAALACEAGAAAVYVSNHGGRALDAEPATIEVLAEVVSAVGGQCPVYVDGGFSRGVEVCAALALGAAAVGLGRLQLWGLALGGASGLEHVLGIVESEIASAMALLGATSCAELAPEHVRWLARL